MSIITVSIRSVKDGDYHLKTHLLLDLFIETNRRNHICIHIFWFEYFMIFESKVFMKGKISYLKIVE